MQKTTRIEAQEIKNSEEHVVRTSLHAETV